MYYAYPLPTPPSLVHSAVINTLAHKHPLALLECDTRSLTLPVDLPSLSCLSVSLSLETSPDDLVDISTPTNTKYNFSDVHSTCIIYNNHSHTLTPRLCDNYAVAPSVS